jgi:hypothetical protein
MSELEPPVTPSAPEPTEAQIKLYTLLVDQVQKYSTILWQFPTALLAANSFAIDKFLGKSVLFVGLAVVDVALVYAFQRLISHQRAVIDAAKKAEEDLRKTKLSSYVPTFHTPTLRASDITLGVLWLMTAALAFYSVSELIRAFHCCCCS